ncbi:hypothetical protein SLE2022_034600 [Rubroshorea leprosula]
MRGSILRLVLDLVPEDSENVSFERRFGNNFSSVRVWSELTRRRPVVGNRRASSFSEKQRELLFALFESCQPFSRASISSFGLGNFFEFWWLLSRVHRLRILRNYRVN